MGAPYINLLVWTLGVAKGVLGLPPQPLSSDNEAMPIVAKETKEAKEVLEAKENLKNLKGWRQYRGFIESTQSSWVRRR